MLLAKFVDNLCRILVAISQIPSVDLFWEISDLHLFRQRYFATARPCQKLGAVGTAVITRKFLDCTDLKVHGVFIRHGGVIIISRLMN